MAHPDRRCRLAHYRAMFDNIRDKDDSSNANANPNASSDGDEEPKSNLRALLENREMTLAEKRKRRDQKDGRDPERDGPEVHGSFVYYPDGSQEYQLSQDGNPAAWVKCEEAPWSTDDPQGGQW